jgi:hypothetical protein
MVPIGEWVLTADCVWEAKTSTSTGHVYNSDAAGGCYSVWLHDSHYYRLHPLRFPLPGGVQHAGLTP